MSLPDSVIRINSIDFWTKHSCPFVLCSWRFSKQRFRKATVFISALSFHRREENFSYTAWCNSKSDFSDRLRLAWSGTVCCILQECLYVPQYLSAFFCSI